MPSSRPLPRLSPDLSGHPALILNFTGNSYHWGCYGTSNEIYCTLLERGYAPYYLSVSATHHAHPVPKSFQDFDSREFSVRMLEANPFLSAALNEAELVIVNGEGTLHHDSFGAINLLYFAWIAKLIFKKPVHLINHSFYPSGNRKPLPQIDDVYAAVASRMDSVVAREIYSHEVHLRLGIPARLGFDNLPRFILRHASKLKAQMPVQQRMAAPLLLAGGVDMTEANARCVARSVGAKRSLEQPILFLTGARMLPAAEDARIFEWMRSEVPEMILVTAGSFGEWMQTIAGAACLISGRFHHSIAAATLGTPFVTFPSNTPKLEAITEMLGVAQPIPYDDPALEEKIVDAIDLSLAAQNEGAILQRRARIVALADENFKCIPDLTDAGSGS